MHVQVYNNIIYYLLYLMRSSTRTMHIIKEMVLKILVFFVTISSHCSKSKSSFESQKYFKKMKDYGKHAWMHAYMYSNFKQQTKEFYIY